MTRIARSLYYLRNCPQNSILITFGDNDTYPMWYVQEKENFRTDVTVLNYSLLGAGIYVNALRQNNTVAFTTDLKSFGNTSFNYLPTRIIIHSAAPHRISQPLSATFNPENLSTIMVMAKAWQPIAPER